MKHELVAVGINHKGAPVELREKLAVPDADVGPVLGELVREDTLREAMIVSTCNRTEIYGVVEDWSVIGKRLLARLAEIRDVPVDEVENHGFVRGSSAAARHIFRVAASLESMVVGEPQILGQVKDALQRARDGGFIGPVLDRCLTTAFRGAKRVRTETDIARGAASVPSVAVDLARSIFGELNKCAALLIGAGEMSQQAGLHLSAGGVSELIIVNRSEERGRRLAQQVGGYFVGWDKLGSQLQRTDIVVTSTGSQIPVIRRSEVRPALRARRHRPIFFVDIAVPRDVAPDVAALDHVFLYNIDDLQGIVHDNMRGRIAETQRASALVEEELGHFVRWERSRAVGPLIGELQAYGRDIVDAEVRRALNRLAELSPEQRAVIEQMGRSIMQKLLHRPMSSLREANAESPEAEVQDGEVLADALQTLFRLADAEDPGQEQADADQADPLRKPLSEASR